jgi:hypothetical protein
MRQLGFNMALSRGAINIHSDITDRRKKYPEKGTLLLISSGYFFI